VAPESMHIQVNGKALEMPARSNLQGLIEHLKLGQRRLAVEMNGEIVPRSEYAQRALNDGDRLEIVHAIGGG
jgi:sulfur carrier protein